ncbi:uncharacterized protein BcabD6B2_54380 [Babesia caballi]|uniref:Variant erythrocyte surface antigen-1, beta subunit n=1 Tax=Babesia caballi TaxID=5871 RepID=A0AAV4M1Q5_BABCB|nr:hypothetical protein, conserved [Babesia caballi]
MSASSGNALTECPSNLKEAIDWILRVTGKDGGGGTDGANDLTREVKNLISEVKGTDPKLTVDIGNIEKALDSSSGTNLITKLTEGLQQFIGYNGSGKITGAGIAPSNVATHRLCDAAIAFTIGVLEGCKKSVQINSQKTIQGVIDKLYWCYGSGTLRIRYVGDEVKAGLSGVTGNGVSKIVTAVKDNFQQICYGLPSFSHNVKAVDLAKNVGDYIAAVFKGGMGSSVIGVGRTLQHLVQQAITGDAYNPIQSKNEINNVNNAINTALRLFRSQNATNPLNSALATGVTAFIAHLKAKYESAYQPNMTTWDESQASKCAKIFLGCIPVIFNALCFFYWKCEKTSWKTMTLGGHGYDLDIMWFMYSMGYSSTFLSGSKTGQAVVNGAFAKFGGFSSVLSPASKSYHDFYAELHKTLPENFNGQTNSSDALRALYYCALYYFTYKHSTISAPTKSPSTIREMLYFLAALPFTPEYGELEKHIDSLLPRSIPISIGGIDHSKNPIFLNSANIKGNLPTTSLFATRILGLLQGPGNSKQHTSEPWLHELYCNTDFQFKYPAGSALFNALSNYTYALQFQLYFLYKQCSSKYTESCGWRDCAFGEGVNASGASVQSHICGAYQCGDKPDCRHDGNTKHSKADCKHNEKSASTCGKNTNGSPLQAFLTDNLRGFRLNSSDSISTHLDNHPTGSLCHVKMGFEAKHFRAENTFKGSSIMLTLNYICANSLSPFRRICNYLLFLTKRTPRTLGDLFGFHWQFDAVLTKEASQNSSQFFNYAFLGASLGNKVENNALIGALAKMNGSDKSHASNATADLMSLYYPLCKSHTSCGPYLNPITYTTGTIFSRDYASTYLSWVLYLADDFYDWLRELLGRFNSVTCNDCVQSRCGPHTPGSHGSTCSCPSIVECCGVLPLYYEYGFTVLDPRMLKLGKKACSAFHTQLTNVVNGKLLLETLDAVDNFLYAMRHYFLSNLSGFWTTYIGLILYTFFFLLDTLHVRSHLRLTASHTVPPLALLTSGTPLPATKLTYITQ